MVQFDNNLLGHLRLLAESCARSTGFLKDGKPDIAGHRLYARLVREHFHEHCSPEHFAIVQFCAEECERQDDADVPMATFDMIQAYQFALANLEALRPVTPDEIKVLYALVKPRLNTSGFRYQPVTVNGEVLPADHLEHNIEVLCEWQASLSAEDFYLWLEHFHPGNDGNGRVGAILFNLKNGTLERPLIAPPYRDPRESREFSVFGDVEAVPPGV